MVVKVKMAAEAAAEAEADVPAPEEVNTNDEEVVSGDADEWGDLLEEFEAPEEEETAERVDEVVDEVAAKEEDAVVEPEPEPVVEPEPAPVETAPEAKVDEPVEEPVERKTPEEEAAEFEVLRTKAEDELVNTFKLTEEQEDLLTNNPNKVLPQMMAKLYLDSYASVMSAVQQQMPQMIQQVIAQTKVTETAQDNFFTKWPGLAKPEYRQTLDRIADTYRAINPKSTEAEFMQEVGVQAWVALRLPMDELVAQTGGAPTPDEPAPTSRSPAGPGNASSQGKTPVKKPMNEFELFAEEILDDED